MTGWVSRRLRIEIYASFVGFSITVIAIKKACLFAQTGFLLDRNLLSMLDLRQHGVCIADFKFTWTFNVQ